MKTPNFSSSEEAFLLKSLHEVVKVWASGNGKATFNLKIENGSAELQLAFRLGHPSDVHHFPIAAAAAIRVLQDMRKIALELRSMMTKLKQLFQ